MIKKMLALLLALLFAVAVLLSGCEAGGNPGDCGERDDRGSGDCG